MFTLSSGAISKVLSMIVSRLEWLLAIEEVVA